MQSAKSAGIACLVKLCRDFEAINMDLDSSDSGINVSWERLTNVSALSLMLAVSHSSNASMQECSERVAEARPAFAERDKLLTIP